MPTTAQLAPPTLPAHHRFHFLDGLRGMAAAIVVVAHMPFYTRTPHNNAGLAVDFFFCLSGFVLAFSYEKRLRQGMGARQFAALRFIRLYPTYLLAVLVGMLFYRISPIHADAVPVWRLILLALAHLLFIPNYIVRNIPDLFPYDSPAWSLFYEILISAIYCGLVRSRLDKNWVLITVGIVAIVTIHASPIGMFLGWSHVWPQPPVGLARAVLAFFAGVLAWRIFQSRPEFSLAPALQFFAAVAVVSVMLIVYLPPFGFMLRTSFRLAVVSLLFGPLVYAGALVKVPSIGRALCNFCGEASYPFYLLHLHFLNVLNNHEVRHYLAPHHVEVRALCLLLIAGVLLLSAFVVRFYELPVRRRLRLKYNAVFATCSA